MKKTVILFFLIITCFTVVAQQDTAAVNVPRKEERDPGPRRAAIMSALLPGLGQAYNKSYWKIPIIYAAEGTLLYFAITNGREFTRFRNAYLIRTDTSSTQIDEFASHPVYQDTETLQLERDNFRRNRDLAIVFALLVYGINILDANIDAHLKGFQMGDDLSLHIKPFYYTGNTTNLAAGLSLSLKLR